MALTVSLGSAAMGEETSNQSQIPGKSSPRKDKGPDSSVIDGELPGIIDFLPHQIMVFDVGGRLLHANKMVLEYTGRTLEEMRALDTQERVGKDIHPEDVDRGNSERDRRLSAGQQFEFECRARRKDGVYRWFLFHYKPMLDANGNVQRWYCTATDIEDNKRAEERIRNKETETANQLRQIVNTTPGLGWTARPDGQADFLNQQWLDYSGLSLGEGLGWGFLDTIHPDDFPQMMEDWQRSLQTGDSFETEGRVRRHDGEYRRFLFRGNAVRDSEGNIVKWIGIDTDVEDLRRAEEALRASEQSLRLVIDTIPGLVHVASPSGEVEYVSQNEIDYFGKTLDELKNWACLIHPDDRERVVNYWQDRVNTGELYDTEVRLLRADGVFRWVHVQGVPLPSDTGQVIRCYFLMTDVDEQKKAEAKLKRNEAYLLEAQRLSHTGSFGCDTATGEMTWSDETFRIFGYEQSVTPTAEHILSRVHPEDGAIVQAQMNRMLNGSYDCDVEFRALFPDSSIKYLHMVAHTVKYEPQGFIGAVIDVTEQKRTHDALERSERYLQDSQRLSNAGSFAWTPSTGAITYLSDEAFRIIGFDAAEGVPGFEECLLRVHPDDRLRWEATIEHAVSAKARYTLEHRLLMPDGTVRHLDLLANPKTNSSGDLVEYVGTVIDITERWGAQEALRESEHRLRLLIEAIPTFIWCAAPNGSLVYANQRLCNYAGKTPEDVLGWNWIPLVHPDDVEQTKAAWRDCLKQGLTLEIAQRLRSADGTYRWFQTLAEPLLDRENRIIQWYGLNIDIDESRNLAEALRASQARLSRATQIATVAELSASIAHEINQPLGAVVANGDACEMWLSSDPPNIERARLAVGRIIRDANAAAEVIQRIRALFKQAIPNKLRIDLKRSSIRGNPVCFGRVEPEEHQTGNGLGSRFAEDRRRPDPDAASGNESCS